MATINGKTSEKIDELVNASVVTGSLSSTGDLTLTTRGGTLLSLGSVGTSIVAANIDPSGNLILTKRDGSTINAGSVGRRLDSWPVGSIFITTSTTSPATSLGGTWTRYAKGKVLVGLDEGDTSFDTLEELGGEKTHTLTAAESGSPAHGHTAYSDVQGAHTHGVYKATGAAGSLDGFNINTATTQSSWGGMTQADGGHAHNITVNASGAANAAQAHNNLQPYIVVYMWKRTA